MARAVNVTEHHQPRPAQGRWARVASAARMLPVLGLALVGAAATARSAPPLSDCDAPGFEEVLQAAAAPAPAATAHWIDARHLLIVPGAGAAPVQLTLQAPGVGAWPLRAVAVSAADAALDPAARERWAYLRRAGTQLWTLPPLPRRTLVEALKQPLRVDAQDARGQSLPALGLQLPGVLDTLYAAAADLQDLGVQLRPTATSTATSAATTTLSTTRWRLWAPTARAVAVCVYPGPDAPAAARWAMQPDARTGSWQARVPGDLSGRYYRYLVEVWVPGRGVVRQRVTDPYSVSLSADSARSFIADLADARYKPAGWDAELAAFRAADPVRRPTDLAVYELHLRDFSISDDSVPPAHRGRYLAFTDADSAGMRHLRALAQAGLTDVHLLPVFDIASVPERGCRTPAVPAAGPDSPAQQAAVMAGAAQDCFNWGYDPLHYSAPEGSYASDANDGARRLIEFRQMVMALHRAGLRVGMDVVYNHTAAAGQHPQSVLDRIVPGYYQRLSPSGQIERSTCCDNTATEHRMMGKLMRDSVRLWARAHGIDSFRFDLMGHQPRAEMLALQAELQADQGRLIPLIGEGWNFGEVAGGARFVQASQGSLNGSGIGTFNDRLRDAVRGGGAGDQGAALVERQGYINGLAWGGDTPALRQAAALVRVGLAGSLRSVVLPDADGRQRPAEQIVYGGDQPAGYASQPAEVVNYVENHDNHTLFDANVFKLPPETSLIDRARVQVLGLALTALAQGVPYFHAGVDLLRSKSLDGNSYDSGDWFNRLDWTGRASPFGSGLPPERDNAANGPTARQRLAQPGLRPDEATVAFTAGAFRDLLRIRASSPLFRLGSAAEVQQRLRFPALQGEGGSPAHPGLIALRLDGREQPGAGFDAVLLLFNPDRAPQTVNLPGEAGLAWQLHPVHLAAQAADTRIAAQARVDAAQGRFELPALSAVVFVVKR